MPPKKDVPTAATTIVGYYNKETRLLAAAFVASVGPDKYDYPLFAKLSGFTEGTLRKFWPPVKKKVIEEHPNFGTFIGGGSAATAPASRAGAGKKRKAADAETEVEPKPGSVDTTDSKTSDGKKKAPAKGKGRGKKVRNEETDGDKKVKEEENSADGGDSLDKA